MIVEPAAGDRVEDNLNPVGRAYYSFSTFLCTPASLSQEVGLALGAQAGEARIRDVVSAGGFTRFRRAAETPFNIVYEATALNLTELTIGEARPEQTRARYPDSEGYVERGGVRTFYEVYGGGAPTILLLPPWSIVHSRCWKMQIPYLSRHCRVVTFDGRGNGRSDHPPEPEAYAETEYAADALAVLDATETAAPSSWPGRWGRSVRCCWQRSSPRGSAASSSSVPPYPSARSSAALRRWRHLTSCVLPTRDGSSSTGITGWRTTRASSTSSCRRCSRTRTRRSRSRMRWRGGRRHRRKPLLPPPLSRSSTSLRSATLSLASTVQRWSFMVPTTPSAPMSPGLLLPSSWARPSSVSRVRGMAPRRVSRSR